MVQTGGSADQTQAFTATAAPSSNSPTVSEVQNSSAVTTVSVDSQAQLCPIYVTFGIPWFIISVLFTDMWLEMGQDDTAYILGFGY